MPERTPLMFLHPAPSAVAGDVVLSREEEEEEDEEEDEEEREMRGGWSVVR